MENLNLKLNVAELFKSVCDLVLYLQWRFVIYGIKLCIPVFSQNSEYRAIAFNFDRRTARLRAFLFSDFATAFPCCTFQHLS